MKLTKLFTEFFDSEKAGGLILVIVTIISLILANSAVQVDYMRFWQHEVAGHSVVHWINDGLMCIFFLMIGLELEREFFKGELSNLRNASLSAFGALGGMLVPAGIFMIFNYGTLFQSGAGIPMATDIAFAIGVLSLLGKRVPASLKVFLIALAVIDDLGAILVIAIFYTTSLSLLSLAAALGILAVLGILNWLKVYNLVPYLIGGVAAWYFMLQSGVHATITGVLLAFVIPFGDGGSKSPSYVIQHFLHKPVAFLILPLFALANTALAISSDWGGVFNNSSSMGIVAGLVIGKPFGIFIFAFLAIKMGLGVLPSELRWKHILGAGMLAGIGFTMSIFITLLAYTDVTVINNSKIAILASSLVAGILGLLILRLTLPKKNPQGIPVDES